MPSEEEHETTKFSAMSEKGKELWDKSVDVTKNSSKKAYKKGKQLTEEGISQAKEGIAALSKKKDDYVAQRSARKIEESEQKLREQSQENLDSEKTNLYISEENLEQMVFESKNEFAEQPTQMDLIQEQMKQIEHEFPTVLHEGNKPVVKVRKPLNWPRLFASTALFAISLLTLIHTLAPYSDSAFIEFIAKIIKYLVPSWLSDSPWPLVLGTITTLVLIVSSILTITGGRMVTSLLWFHYAGVLIIGRILYTFYSDIQFDAVFVFDILRDALRTLVLVGISQSHRALPQLDYDENGQTIFEYSGILSSIGKKSNTPDELVLFIEEGLTMDFRTEVAKPKPPRARAKFEGYEVILLGVSFLLWPVTIIMTMAFEGGLNPYMDYSSGPIQVGAVWALSLLTLLALVRFDRSARGNGWYAKEKETYVGMMDLYSKAQAKHYEYVELRAAAEAQEILEKYPQLDTSKTSRSTKA